MKTFNQWLEAAKDENVCPQCGSKEVSYPRCCTKAKTCMSCRNEWVVKREESGAFSCCDKYTR